MAFPTVAGRTNSQVVTDGTTHAVSLPAGTIASGDLLIVHFVVDGNPTLTWPTNWVQTVRAHGDGTASRSAVAYKIADGTEGSSINVTSSVAEKSCHRSWHITGWHGTTVPEMASAVQSLASSDPPSLSPSWGAADTLWLALHGHENSITTITGYPTSYTNTFTQNTTGGAGSAATNVTQGCAERQNNTATEDPAAFTMDGSRVTAAFTVAVRPGAGGQSAAVGQTTETDTAQAFTRAKTLGLVTQTDTALAITAVKTAALGLVAETDLAQVITAQQAGGGQSVAVGQTIETDTAQTLTRAKTLGLVTHTDQALAITATKTVTLGLVTETDVAQTVVLAGVVGQATETDLALSVTATKTVTLGLVTETGLAQGFGRAVELALAVETDAALAVAAQQQGFADPNPHHAVFREPSTHSVHGEASHAVYRETSRHVHAETSHDIYSSPAHDIYREGT